MLVLLLSSRLSVINHKWVKVELRDGGSLPGDEGRQIWFTIGSVDTFERNLVILSFAHFSYLDKKSHFGSGQFVFQYLIKNLLALAIGSLDLASFFVVFIMGHRK